LPAVAGAAAALEPGAPRLWDQWPDNVMLHYHFKHGDPDGVLAAADVVVSEVIRCQRHTGMPMETRACLAVDEGRRLTVWTNSQWPHIHRSVIAECLGLPEHALRVAAPDVGGGFGVEYHIYPEDVLVPFAARRLGRPVKWVEDRREHFLSTVHSREQEIRVTLGFRRDGTLLAVKADALMDLGTGAIVFSGAGPMPPGAASMPMGYRFEHYEYRGRAVVTNKTPFGAYRGFGVTEVAQALERAMDLAAERLGMDPADLRLRNLIGPEDLPYRTATGAYLTTGSYRLSLEAALEAAGYRELRQRQRREPGGTRRLGIGAAPRPGPQRGGVFHPGDRRRGRGAAGGPPGGGGAAQRGPQLGGAPGDPRAGRPLRRGRRSADRVGSHQGGAFQPRRAGQAAGLAAGADPL